MSKNRIWLSSPHMGTDERRFINDVFESNWIAPLGKHVDLFEEELCAITSSGYAAVLNSGTSAIHLALVLLDVGPGDIVLCQSFTFSATANPILYQRATPVFIDSEPSTWNMCPDSLEDALRHYRNKGIVPKAILPVHLYGMPAMMGEISEIADRYGVAIIEDAAEAIGSTYRGKPCGSLGKMGILSFNGNKIITTSAGGALRSDDISIVERARY